MKVSKQYLYVVTGRVYGDDDDTLLIVVGETDDQARDVAVKALSRERSEKVIREDGDSNIFVTSTFMFAEYVPGQDACRLTANMHDPSNSAAHLYAVSGRIPGDDDDVAYPFYGQSASEAEAAFRALLNENLSETEIKSLEAAHGKSVFVIDTEYLGTVSDGVLTLDAVLEIRTSADFEETYDDTPTF